jgi:hypothetical protein
LGQLVPRIPAASSNRIVSANAGDQAAIGRIKNINRIGFMDSFGMKLVPRVKLFGRKT